MRNQKTTSRVRLATTALAFTMIASMFGAAVQPALLQPVNQGVWKFWLLLLEKV